MMRQRFHSHARLLACVTLLIGAMGVPAVAQNMTSDPGASAAPGRSDTKWEMESIDGEHLPIVNEFEHSTWGSCRVEVLSGSLVLSADHQFRLETHRKIHCEEDGESTVAQEQPEWLEGAYTLEAGQLTMTVGDPNIGEMAFSGAVSGDHLRVQFDENELRFRPGE